MSLFTELKRRNVFRVGLFYIVAAWVVVQVAETILPMFSVPDGALRAIVVILALGFPLALVFSWIFELTPDGLKLDKNAQSNPEAKRQTAHKLNLATLIAAVLAIGLLAADRMMPEPAAEPVSEVATRPQAEAENLAVAGSESAEATVNPASIAVLPFEDLSPDGDQQYFSDGIAEEILNVLVRIDGLDVASRTSAFRFRNRADIGIPGIADALEVRHVLEGSVRKAGESIRVTAQLIDGQSDKHVWSETYDRLLSIENVFAIQDEIATAIVAALRESLQLPVEVSVEVDNSTNDLSAYELFLKARTLYQSRSNLDEADNLLEQAITLDPEFANAWAMRAAIHALMPDYGYESLSRFEAYAVAVEYAEIALDLNRDSALALAVLANVQFSKIQELEPDVSFETMMANLTRAIELDPRNTSALNWIGLAHLWLGHLEKALDAFVRCNEIDPRYGPCKENHYDTLASMGRYQDAIRVLDKALDKAIGTEYWVSYALLAHFEEELAFKLLAMQPSGLAGWQDTKALYDAFRNLDSDHSELAESLTRFLEQEHPEAFGSRSYLSGLLIPIGVFDVRPTGLWLWSPEFKRYRQSPQFRNVIRASGALDYWVKHGFPAFCRPVVSANGEDDFECD